MGNGCMRGKAVEVTSPTLPSFKVVVVGDSGSGKSSIIQRFVENRFDSEYSRTTDVDITSVVKKLNVPEHAIVTVELWDVPGQNDVDLRKTYYLDVDAVIVVVDISRDDSLNVAGSWSLDVSNHARVSRTFTESVPNPDGKTFAKKIRKEYLRPKPGAIPVLLLGNKYDLAKTKYMKEYEETEKLEAVNEPQSEEKADTETAKNGTSKPSLDSTTPTDTTDHSNEESKKNTDGSQTVKPDSAGLENNSKSQNRGDTAANSIDVDKPEDSTNVDTNGGKQNGEVPKQNGGMTLKKIHPKDEKNMLNGSKGLVSESPLLEDSRSAVTMATSVMSVLPPCVEEIERIAEKYGFIAGVPVSAKTANGGVQEAIQSILRRLVAKQVFNLDMKESMVDKRGRNFELSSTKSMKSSRSKTSARSKKRMPGAFEPLQEVGIIEIDEVIRRCNPSLQQAEVLSSGYAEAFQGLKLACYKCGFTPSTRVTLEACITALKQAVAMNSDLDAVVDPRENIKLILMTPEKQEEKKKSALVLSVEDGDGFPNLQIVTPDGLNVEKLNQEATKPEEQITVQPKILKVLTEYREKFFHNCSSVLKHGGEVEAVLGQRAKELAAKEEKAWETSVAAGLSPEDVRKILSIIAQDKARLRGTSELIKDAKRSVQTSAAKIKAAVLF